MSEKVEIVEINHLDIIQMADRLENQRKSEINNCNEQFMAPAEGGNRETNTPSQSNKGSESGGRKNTAQDTSRSRRTNRRPDVQVYVPRGKQQVNSEQRKIQPSEASEDTPESDSREQTSAKQSGKRPGKMKEEEAAVRSDQPAEVDVSVGYERNRNSYANRKTQKDALEPGPLGKEVERGTGTQLRQREEPASKENLVEKTRNLTLSNHDSTGDESYDNHSSRRGNQQSNSKGRQRKKQGGRPGPTGNDGKSHESPTAEQSDSALSNQPKHSVPDSREKGRRRPNKGHGDSSRLPDDGACNIQRDSVRSDSRPVKKDKDPSHYDDHPPSAYQPQHSDRQPPDRQPRGKPSDRTGRNTGSDRHPRGKPSDYRNTDGKRDATDRSKGGKERKASHGDRAEVPPRFQKKQQEQPLDYSEPKAHQHPEQNRSRRSNQAVKAGEPVEPQVSVHSRVFVNSKHQHASTNERLSAGQGQHASTNERLPVGEGEGQSTRNLNDGIKSQVSRSSDTRGVGHVTPDSRFDQNAAVDSTKNNRTAGNNKNHPGDQGNRRKGNGRHDRQRVSNFSSDKRQYSPPPQHDDSSVHHDDSSVHHDDSAVHRDDSSVHRDDSAVHRDDSAVHRGDSSVHRDDSSVHRGDSSVHRGDSSVHHDDSSVHRGDSSVHRGDSAVQSGASSRQRQLSEPSDTQPMNSPVKESVRQPSTAPSGFTGGLIRLPAGPTHGNAAPPSQPSNRGRRLYDPNCPNSRYAPNPTVDPASSADLTNRTFDLHSREGHVPHPGYSGPQPYAAMPTGSMPTASSAMQQYYTVPPPMSHSRRDTTYDDMEIGLGSSSPVSQPGRPVIEPIMAEYMATHYKLSDLLVRRLYSSGMELIYELRMKVRDLLEKVIMVDVEYAYTSGLDQALWKSVYHSIIETIRQESSTGDSDLDCNRMALDILGEGTVYFEALLCHMEDKWCFRVAQFCDPELTQPEVSRLQRFALLMSQRLLLCLGDLARYKEQVQGTANYGKSRSWYVKAQHLAPKNGRPYSQLAVLATYTKRRLDAVYYHVRSLAVSNPILTSADNLLVIYNDVRKKAETIKQVRGAKMADHRSGYRLDHRMDQSAWGEQGLRVERWISWDGSSVDRKVRDGEEDEEDFSKMAVSEINRQFIMEFLYSQGKLFTKIGMETFPESSSRTLHLFGALLGHSAGHVGSSRLTQLMCICMFSMGHTAMKDMPAGSKEVCRSFLQEQAIQFSLDLFGLLVQHALHHLKLSTKDGRCHGNKSGPAQSSGLPGLPEEVRLVLPSLKLFSDWMTCHPHLWNPPPCPRDPTLGPVIDVWHSLADFFNQLQMLPENQVNLSHTGTKVVLLEEDAVVAGFQPLQTVGCRSISYVDEDVDQVAARDAIRVQKLTVFADYLCGVEPPMLDFSSSAQQYVSCVQPPSQSEKTSEPALASDDEGIEDESNTSVYLDSASEEEAGEERLGALRAKRRQLQRQIHRQEKSLQQREAILEREAVRLTLEIRPMFLVPDTNCFIDFLPAVQQVLACGRYTIVVPLVVINELDGIGKGRLDMRFLADQSDDSVSSVASCARKAVEFMEGEFEVRNPRLKSITSKGTVIDSITYRTEETTDDRSNDDRILSCCLYYCQDKARDFMPREKNAPITLSREVVLLTNDRNLRIKAHMRNVPVKDLISFIGWAKIGKGRSRR